jgi:hypothetical protein
VIDWGDGSGEVALDTLTPTHTYSKAGKYVVKVKGVTGIAAQITQTDYTPYVYVLKAAEIIVPCSTASFASCLGLINLDISNNDTIPITAFQYCCDLEDVTIDDDVTQIGASGFRFCMSLNNVTLPSQLTGIGNSAFYYNIMLHKIIIPVLVTSIDNLAFGYCSRLAEIHIQRTTPPTLGTNVFANISPDFIIYVPVGTAETYKAASGWSSYADHILEEGQTPNRAMIAKFNSENTDNEEMR